LTRSVVDIALCSKTGSEDLGEIGMACLASVKANAVSSPPNYGLRIGKAGRSNARTAGAIYGSGHRERDWPGKAKK